MSYVLLVGGWIVVRFTSVNNVEIGQVLPSVSFFPAEGKLLGRKGIGLNAGV